MHDTRSEQSNREVPVAKKDEVGFVEPTAGLSAFVDGGGKIATRKLDHVPVGNTFAGMTIPSGSSVDVRQQLFTVYENLEELPQELRPLIAKLISQALAETIDACKHMPELIGNEQSFELFLKKIMSQIIPVANKSASEIFLRGSIALFSKTKGLDVLRANFTTFLNKLTIQTKYYGEAVATTLLNEEKNEWVRNFGQLLLNASQVEGSYISELLGNFTRTAQEGSWPIQQERDHHLDQADGRAHFTVELELKERTKDTMRELVKKGIDPNLACMTEAVLIKEQLRERSEALLSLLYEELFNEPLQAHFQAPESIQKARMDQLLSRVHRITDQELRMLAVISAPSFDVVEIPSTFIDEAGIERATVREVSKMKKSAMDERRLFIITYEQKYGPILAEVPPCSQEIFKNRIGGILDELAMNDKFSASQSRREAIISEVSEEVPKSGYLSSFIKTPKSMELAGVIRRPRCVVRYKGVDYVLNLTDQSGARLSRAEVYSQFKQIQHDYTKFITYTYLPTSPDFQGPRLNSDLSNIDKARLISAEVINEITFHPNKNQLLNSPTLLRAELKKYIRKDLPDDILTTIVEHIQAILSADFVISLDGNRLDEDARNGENSIGFGTGNFQLDFSTTDQELIDRLASGDGSVIRQMYLKPEVVIPGKITGRFIHTMTDGVDAATEVLYFDQKISAGLQEFLKRSQDANSDVFNEEVPNQRNVQPTKYWRKANFSLVHTDGGIESPYKSESLRPHTLQGEFVLPEPFIRSPKELNAQHQVAIIEQLRYESLEQSLNFNRLINTGNWAELVIQFTHRIAEKEQKSYATLVETSFEEIWREELVSLRNREDGDHLEMDYIEARKTAIKNNLRAVAYSEMRIKILNQTQQVQTLVSPLIQAEEGIKKYRRRLLTSDSKQFDFSLDPIEIMRIYVGLSDQEKQNFPLSFQKIALQFSSYSTRINRLRALWLEDSQTFYGQIGSPGDPLDPVSIANIAKQSPAYKQYAEHEMGKVSTFGITDVAQLCAAYELRAGSTTRGVVDVEADRLELYVESINKNLITAVNAFGNFEQGLTKENIGEFRKSFGAVMQELFKVAGWNRTKHIADARNRLGNLTVLTASTSPFTQRMLDISSGLLVRGAKEQYKSSTMLSSVHGDIDGFTTVFSEEVRMATGQVWNHEKKKMAVHIDVDADYLFVELCEAQGLDPEKISIEQKNQLVSQMKVLVENMKDTTEKWYIYFLALSKVEELQTEKLIELSKQWKTILNMSDDERRKRGPAALHFINFLVCSIAVKNGVPVAQANKNYVSKLGQ